MEHVVALSGGKDSTALALRLAETEPREYTYLVTPTGDELPELLAHWERLEALLGRPLTRISNGTLDGWIAHFNALPSWRMRWCTRLLKIEPALAYMRAHAPALLYVGLRADEEERRGIISRDVECRFPLREWGWDEAAVRAYLQARGVAIPARTDCARCYGQRLGEWRSLLLTHPDIYAAAEQQEAAIGATFRSPGRDRQPAALADLRRRFQEQAALPMLEEEETQVCRVCRL